MRDPNDPNDDFIPWKYTWGLDLAGQNGQVNSLEGAGTIGGLLAMQDMDDPNDPSDPNDATGRFACFYDGNGNLTQLLHLGTWDPNNPEVAIRAHYEYDPYGNVVRQTGSYAAANPWRFRTKQFDAETGLGYWGYRYYSPTLGRWVSRDPIGELRTGGLYAYVKNRATNDVDYWGLLSVSPVPDPREDFDFNECMKRCAALVAVRQVFWGGPWGLVWGLNTCLAKCTASGQLAGCDNGLGGRDPCGTQRYVRAAWVSCRPCPCKCRAQKKECHHNCYEIRLDWEECKCDRTKYHAYFETGRYVNFWKRVSECVPNDPTQGQPSPIRHPQEYDLGSQKPDDTPVNGAY